MDYKKYEPIFGEWKIIDKIGEGSFGKVFVIEREDFGKKYYAALKAITIPACESEIKSAMADGLDESSLSDYFFSGVKRVVNEFELMSTLKGNSHIVSYENHKVIPHEDGIGWDILIQMELLTPINEYLAASSVTRDDIIKLGIDICQALEMCHKLNIIHRDIKPENIFISPLGEYKLGDFGISRTTDGINKALSKKGTYGYMAPEVYKGEPYDSLVDIYSLGLVMYKLFNNNRLPFFPPYPQPIRFSDKDEAFIKRMNGESVDYPINAKGELGDIILKAIAFKSGNRFSSAEAMRKALQELQQKMKDSPEQDESIYIYVNKVEDFNKTVPWWAMDKNHRDKDSFGFRNNNEDSTVFPKEELYDRSIVINKTSALLMTETKTDLGITNNSFTFVNEDYEETLDNILLPNDIVNSHRFCLNIGFLSFLCSILTIAMLQVFYIFF